MANRLLKPLKGCLEAGVVKLFGSVTTSTSGTIASQACKGFSVAKTATKTGRYTVTLADKYNGLLACAVVVQGADDAQVASAKGVQAMLRAVDMTNGVFKVQFLDRQTQPADAELEDGAIFRLEITLKDSTAY